MTRRRSNIRAMTERTLAPNEAQIQADQALKIIRANPKDHEEYPLFAIETQLKITIRPIGNISDTFFF